VLRDCLSLLIIRSKGLDRISATALREKGKKICTGTPGTEIKCATTKGKQFGSSMCSNSPLRTLTELKALPL